MERGAAFEVRAGELCLPLKLRVLEARRNAPETAASPEARLPVKLSAWKRASRETAQSPEARLPVKLRAPEARLPVKLHFQKSSVP